MSDDNPDTPLDFPPSDTEYYPEHVENLASHRKPLHKWEPESLQIMEEAGFGPEDMENSTEEESPSEQGDSDEEEEEFEEGELVHLVANFMLMRLDSNEPTSASSACWKLKNKTPRAEASFKGWYCQSASGSRKTFSRSF